MLALLLGSPGLSAPAMAVEAKSGVSGLLATISEMTNDRLLVSGYVNFHVMKHEGAPVTEDRNLNDSLPQLREASLYVDLKLSEALLLSTEIEFSYDFGADHHDGSSDAAQVVANYAYLDFDVGAHLDSFDDDEKGLRFRVGKILVPFLSYNEHKPNFEQALMSPPYTAMHIAPVVTVPIGHSGHGWSDWGATLNWNAMSPTGGVFDLKVTAISGIGSPGDVLDGNTVELETDLPGMPGTHPTVRPRDGFAQNKDHDPTDNNSDIATVFKASYKSANLPLDYGFSWYRGAWDDAGEHDLVMYGAHFNYRHRDWVIKGEAVRAGVEQEAGINPVTKMGPAALNTSTGKYHMSSWYVEGAYVPLRYGDNDDRFLRIIGRYDEVVTNDQVAFTPFDRARWTAGLEWQFYRNTRLRYERQTAKLRSFDMAPSAYSMAGGEEMVHMNMISFLTFF